MAVLKFNEIPFQDIKEDRRRKLIYTENLMMVYIEITGGPWEKPDPPHSHQHEQTSYVAEGEIVFSCEGDPDSHLKAGDMYAVPSGKMHTIRLLTPRVVLVDSFFPLREDFLI